MLLPNRTSPSETPFKWAQTVNWWSVDHGLLAVGG